MGFYAARHFYLAYSNGKILINAKKVPVLVTSLQLNFFCPRKGQHRDNGLSTLTRIAYIAGVNGNKKRERRV